MTGFARVDGHWREVSWTWELRAVNGKGLDVRLRLPSGFERLETPVRSSCKSHLSRGNVQATLSVSSVSDELIPQVNPQALKAVLEAISEIDRAIDTAKSSAAG